MDSTTTFPTETREGLEIDKRVAVEKMYNSSLELAIQAKTKLMNPKDIKKEHVEAMKSDKLQKKEAKKSKKSEECNKNAMATAQSDNVHDQVASRGLHALKDYDTDGNGEEIETEEEEMQTEDSKEDLLERMEELEQAKSLLLQKIQDASKRSTTTSTPNNPEHSPKTHVNLNISPVVPSPRPSTRRSLSGNDREGEYV
ncbi:hypothetical protein QAD02_007455 [Eretmocerus hayati]|uniref:Uncharacterized protein n=1 Tax=Eretmocerus hayati TaxID=131215 RepID=A0ACC2N4Y2_9HYME|nr:hypothetical protein QAD02_007455 [Eretmocerus hayati]